MNYFILKAIILTAILSSGLINPASTLAQTATFQVFTLNLKFGIANQQVAILQQLLADESPEIYPEKMVSGYFGPLTKAAVERFQTKYASEVLAPAGIDTPTGFVGYYTRTKLNKVYMQLYRSGR